MIISRTPLRVSFFGGGTDYPAYFNSGNEGAVIGTTINKYVYITVNKLSSFFDHSIRVTYSKAELVKSVDEIQHPSVRECLKFFDIRSNIEIHHFADLPARTGLGSSSAFTVGLLNALYAHQGKMVRKEKLAQDAIEVEHNRIKERVGCQDQYFASLGGLHQLIFKPGSVSAEPITIHPDKKAELEQSLMLFYTGITRHAHEIVKEQVEKTSRRENDSVLNEMRQMVREAIRKLMAGEVEPFGRLLHEGWALKKKLSTNITTSVIDQAYTEAMKMGAWGGKLAGAGGGGFLLLCTPSGAKNNIRGALTKMGLSEVGFNMENEGSRIIYYHPEEENS